jgi:hypothetical protein
MRSGALSVVQSVRTAAHSFQQPGQKSGTTDIRAHLIRFISFVRGHDERGYPIDPEDPRNR